MPYLSLRGVAHTLRYTLNALLMLFLLFGHQRVQAQLSCLALTAADVENTAQAANFVCVDAGSTSAEVLLSDLLAALPIPGVNKLLPFAQAQNTPQYIAIRGVLRIDPAASEYAFAPGSEIVFSAGSNCGIAVSDGCKLTLKGVSVHGSPTGQFKEVRAEAGSTLIVDGCRIKDGKSAITVHRNATTSILGNTFGRNLASLQLGEEVAVSQFALFLAPNGSISGNTFDGPETFKTPFSSLRPLSGIRVKAVDNIAIGSVGGGTNVFQNFENTHGGQFSHNGITIGNSDVTVLNSRFENIAAASTFAIDGGIYVDNTSTVSVTGMGIFPVSPLTMDNVRTGIYLARGGSASVTAAKFSRFRDGILNDRIDNAGSVPNYIVVNACQFDNYTDRSIGAFSLSGVPTNFSNFSVTSSTFDDNAVQAGSRRGVSVISSSPATVSNFNIRANKFYLRGGTSGVHNFVGIALSNLTGGVVEHNIMENQSNSGSFRGITILDCATSVLYNTITGLNSNLLDEVGMEIMEAPNCVYRCNETSSLVRGMDFRDNCWNTTLFANHFNNNARSGLRLAGDDPNIGQQNTPQRRFNRWIGSGAMEGRIEFVLPLDPVAVALKSQFKVVPADDPSDYWADPRRINNASTNDPNWFVGGSGSLPQLDVCPSFPADPGGDDRLLDYTAQRIVNGDYVPVGGYAANTWDVSFLVYGFLDKNPDYMPTASAAASYYQANYNSNLGKFRRIYDGYLSLTSTLPTSTGSQLLSDLNAVNAVAQHEQNFKKVMRVLLEVNSGTASGLTEQQNADLTEVANQCRLSGGRAVLIARNALGLPVQNTSVCNAFGGGTEDRSKSAPGSLVQVSVFPNPTKGTFTVQTSSTVENGTARLTNLTGQVLKT